MAAEVHKLHPVEVGEGYKFDAGELLDAAKGQSFNSLVIIGETEDGELWCSSMENAGISLILIERAKRLIVFGES